MLYFSRVPVPPQLIDPGQYARLETFRASCESRGLYATYDSLIEFRQKLQRQLGTVMNDPQYFPLSGSSVGSQQYAGLSEHARIFLVEAGKSTTGQINRFDMDTALVIQVNGLGFQADLSDGRARALFEAAIDELEDEQLIRDVSSGKRSLFQLTARGFRRADEMVG